MAFWIIRNDITKVTADAVVNTTDPKPVFASGTDAAIYRAAGEDALLAERKKIGEIEVGKAAATPAFALNAKFIIHTVGPVWQGGVHGEREAVKNCYENSLRLADELGCESIAFPLLATGSYGFSKEDALQIAVSVFREYLAESEMKIFLVVFDEESFRFSGKIFSGIDAYIDEKYVADRMEEEYDEPADTQVELEDTPGFSALAGNPAMNMSVPKKRKKTKSSLFDRLRTAKTGSEESCAAMADSPMTGQAMASAKAETLNDRMLHLADTWQQSLFRLIDEKGYTDTEVYKRANVDRKLFSKIRSNTAYQPKKITAVAFALALGLNLDETKDLLARAGYALSPSSRFDLIVEYFIENGIYDTYTINLALFEHDQPLLGE